MGEFTLRLTWRPDGTGGVLLTDNLTLLWGVGADPLAAFLDWAATLGEDIAWLRAHEPELGRPLRDEWEAVRTAFLGEGA